MVVLLASLCAPCRTPNRCGRLAAAPPMTSRAVVGNALARSSPLWKLDTNRIDDEKENQPLNCRKKRKKSRRRAQRLCRLCRLRLPPPPPLTTPLHTSRRIHRKKKKIAL